MRQPRRIVVLTDTEVHRDGSVTRPGCRRNRQQLHQREHDIAVKALLVFTALCPGTGWLASTMRLIRTVRPHGGQPTPGETKGTPPGQQARNRSEPLPLETIGRGVRVGAAQRLHQTLAFRVGRGARWPRAPVHERRQVRHAPCHRSARHHDGTTRAKRCRGVPSIVVNTALRCGGGSDEARRVTSEPTPSPRN